MRPFFYSSLLLLLLSSCRTTRTGSAARDDGKLDVIFVQVNDVYEIAPLNNGRSGGMARVATLKKHYKQSNPNTFLVMSGDFVSPSVYNSLQYEGKRIRGKQMIESMNAAGMDLAVFGNHEFDINEDELQARINESTFRWVSSNTFHFENGQTVPFGKSKDSLFEPFPKTYIRQVTDADGTTARIGFIGLTLPFNKAAYVRYTDPLTSGEEAYASLKDSCDAVVAITHLEVEEDVRLAQRVPGLAVILGGHEHDMRLEKAGNVYITKAHANARSAFVVTLHINKKSKSVDVTQKLTMLDESVPLDSATNAVVQRWMDIGDQNYASLGFNSKEVLIASGDTLDGRETEVRSGSTNLTELVSAAMLDACPEAELAIYNAGSIRVDDMLAPPVTQYDIIRSLPFGGGIREGEIRGSLLLRVLEAGIKNRGSGGYLQYLPITYKETAQSWSIDNQPIDTAKWYRFAISDFLVSGKESNLSFLTPENPDLRLKDADTSSNNSKSDIRLAIVRFLQKKINNQTGQK